MTDTPRPDLSGLSREDRINIAVAETQGWTYVAQSGFDPTVAVGEPPRSMRADLMYDLDVNGRTSLPRYTTDPAAWGALMEAELTGVESAEFTYGNDPVREWRGRYLTEDGIACAYGRWCPRIGEAIALAFLAKHGVEVEP